ncbi:hypothetical protein FXB70_04795 [Aggregatibacter actinomycetemcomitans]|nr:hypothetical protein SC1000_04160 [Aggregatibacter actinomycetemcomitans]TYA16427.1 hypothetical protein FXE10_02935 [Aggregatibacter actinomycetemcomitans]TYA23707.1 hypothetical protein FXB91_02040 [Aggregatibacter actinomycetemcomitans]TYA25239.1 hypothetical protein FXE05_06350 [Aggregatibacter actinomycetemcomitans]TYA27564.1 hypothetical protein FXB92_02140 [Aggregatibacter actinomycetemcomitans]
MGITSSVFAEGELLFFASPKKSNQKKGDPVLPYFPCSIEFASRKFCKLASLKQYKISYKFNSTRAAKKGIQFLFPNKVRSFFQAFLSLKNYFKNHRTFNNAPWGPHLTRLSDL